MKNKLILSLGLVAVLAGCGEPEKVTPVQDVKPADESTPIARLDSNNIPSMPETPQTAVAPDERDARFIKPGEEAAGKTADSQSLSVIPENSHPGNTHPEHSQVLPENKTPGVNSGVAAAAGAESENIDDNKPSTSDEENAESDSGNQGQSTDAE